MEKLPFLEQILRWIDILGYFDFPDEIIAEAKSIAYSSNYIMFSKRDRPSTLAAACLYLADNKVWEERNQKYKFEKIKSITISKHLKPTGRWNKLEANRFCANINFGTVKKKGECIESGK